MKKKSIFVLIIAALLLVFGTISTVFADELVAINETNFPNNYFRSLVSSYDKDQDNYLSAEERDIGGLGIFLTKQFMDDVAYTHSEGCNMLTIQKKLG